MNRGWSLSITVPPLGGIVLRPEPLPKPEAEVEGESIEGTDREPASALGVAAVTAAAPGGPAETENFPDPTAEPQAAASPEH
jgi:hypothetical protein